MLRRVTRALVRADGGRAYWRGVACGRCGVSADAEAACAISSVKSRAARSPLPLPANQPGHCRFATEHILEWRASTALDIFPSPGEATICATLSSASYVPLI